MRVALASDLHLEHGPIDLYNEDDADVLILSGDIMIAHVLHDHPYMENKTITDDDIFNIYRRTGARMANIFRDFLDRCSSEFPSIVYVAGNHEFYSGKWDGSINDLRKECARYPNIHFLENDNISLYDHTFIGCTLWTDLNKGDPLTQHDLKNNLNDFHCIRVERLGYTKLRPIHTLERHVRSKEYMDEVIRGDVNGKYVIVGHHAPTKLSTHPKYADEYTINGGYSSDLSEFILDHPQIKLWTHGHTHHDFDYMVGDTRIVCNPRGYMGIEEMAQHFKLKYMDI